LIGSERRGEGVVAIHAAPDAFANGTDRPCRGNKELTNLSALLF
jgi:hypothetical protein